MKTFFDKEKKIMITHADELLVKRFQPKLHKNLKIQIIQTPKHT